MKKINIKAIGIGIKAGIVSSLCCILPLILVIFGLASIGTALKIVQFKPYFIALSIILLVSSLILFFKRHNCCRADKKFFIGTAIVTHILIFILLLYVFVPAVSPIIYRNAISKQSQLGSIDFKQNTEVTGNFVNSNITNIKSNLHKLDIKISGMTCAGCAYGIKYQLKQLKGVIDAEVSFSKGRGEVIYNPNEISKKEIIDSVKEPYSAAIVKDELRGE